MIRTKRKNLKLLKFSSRRPVDAVPVKQGSPNSGNTLQFRFIMDPVAAIKAGAETVDIQVVRNKFANPSVLDDYSENGDVIKTRKAISSKNEDANEQFRQGLASDISISVESVISQHMPEIIGIDINDRAAVEAALPVKEVLLTRRGIRKEDRPSSVDIPPRS